MTDLIASIIGWAVLLVALSVIVWRLAKAGGSVDVTFAVHVEWGRK